MSARTMALKAATRGCALNKIPNTRLGSRLDPGFNYVNLTDDQLRAIRIRKGYGITYKQRHSNLRLGRCIEKNTQRGEFKKNTNETWGGSRTTERVTARTATPQSFQVPGVKNPKEQGILEGGLKGRVPSELIFIPSTYKTIEDANIGCKPSKYASAGRILNNTVKVSRLYEGKDYTKHKVGQMIASERPPVTVTKCIGFGKKKQKKRRTGKVINVETGEEIDCDANIGSGNAGFGGVDDACSDGFGDIFFSVGGAPDDSTGATGGISASGTPQQTLVEEPGLIVEPEKTQCNDKQRQFDLQTQLALARSGFGGEASGTGVGLFDFSCINITGAPDGFPCGDNAGCCSNNCDTAVTNTCLPAP